MQARSLAFKHYSCSPDQSAPCHAERDRPDRVRMHVARSATEFINYAIHREPVATWKAFNAPRQSRLKVFRRVAQHGLHTAISRVFTGLNLIE